MKACVVSGSRADFDLLKWLMGALKKDPDFDLQTVVIDNNSHDLESYYSRELENFGVEIDRYISPTSQNDRKGSPLDVLEGVLRNSYDAFENLSPDLIILLGDRSEIFLAAFSATLHNLPIAHIHGGEVTAGAIDDSLRHSITKMSHLHFVVAEEYRDRVVQLGEDPKNVHVISPLGFENVTKSVTHSRESLVETLGIDFGSVNLLVTLHPETRDPAGDKVRQLELLEALDSVPDAHLFITSSNTDLNGQEMADRFKRFAESRRSAWFFSTLGSSLYLSLMAQMTMVVGNSSSGVYEAPVLGVPSLNIGGRQAGRILPPSVVSVSGNRLEILSSILQVVQAEPGEISPFIDEPMPSVQILDVLRKSDPSTLNRKSFIDVVM